ncbi:uncharacterized protein KY384_006684 [Bacidia gigantensis]|uniref:uncharacterized protein n=1 Tax=Bacidia gigantensis TaxID=2732470 RepID=UPI001D04C4A2|nr:uncharacterized protein KY384_006684 [Bacidia gigantensis]KAG8528995.1 hypothetical protein KY384_006684 [Bacidia gigantensis]
MVTSFPTHRVHHTVRSIKLANFYRCFHEYFVTHLPSSSLHPDSRASSGPGHQLPRAASKPHDSTSGPSPAPLSGTHRDTTVVRIPLRSAKHHFGASVSRGSRPYNEDAYQAGVINVPAFANKPPATLTRAPPNSPLQAYREQQRKQQEEATGTKDGGEGQGADSESGDPQVFYFGVFDGHGGTQCSGYLSKELHGGIEDAAKLYRLKSTLSNRRATVGEEQSTTTSTVAATNNNPSHPDKPNTSDPFAKITTPLLRSYKENIGGYFRRFSSASLTTTQPGPSISQILTHAFLQVDLTFLLRQIRLASLGTSSDELPINHHDSLTRTLPSHLQHQDKPFAGGSTASVALISTPTPTPFWNPATSSKLLTAHCGDTRILLCRSSDGAAVPLTTTHHPSTPSEASRLRRFASSFMTDSFGEERFTGSLANTRAFGDIGAKKMGVSAEPEIRLTELGKGEYAFLVLVSDGVTGNCSDQDIVDIVKEARTPEEAARKLTGFAVDIAAGGEDGADNCTALVVRLGGWERRNEGGGGSMGTREEREWRRREAGEGEEGNDLI